MTREDADRQRKLDAIREEEARSIRLGLLAQLSEHPAWSALKEVLGPALSFKAINFEDPQWQGRLTYQHGQSELAVQLIRTVEKAAETVKRKQQEQAAHE